MQRPDLAKTVPATERRPTTCPLPGDEDGAQSQLGSGDNYSGGRVLRPAIKAGSQKN